MGFLHRDAFLPKLILHGLPTDCISSRTAPVWVCTTGSILQELILHGSLTSSSSCQTLAPLWAPFHRLQLQPGVCSCWGSSCVATSFRPDPPALLWYPIGCRGQPAPPWAPLWAAAWRSVPPWYPQATGELLLLCLEHLLPS